MPRLEGSLTWFPGTDAKTNPSPRFISLEIEVDEIGESDKLYEVCRKWNDPIVRDGSLSTSGFEINMNPSSFEKFIEHSKEIAGALAAGEAEVDERCGMHCHVDASDFTPEAVHNLARIYAHTENALYEMLPVVRKKSRFCKPCGPTFEKWASEEFCSNLIAHLYGTDAYGSRRVGTAFPEREAKELVALKHKSRLIPGSGSKYIDARYAALNLHSLFYRGTIEFRHHHGSVTEGEMTHWGMLCASMLDYAMKSSPEEIKYFKDQTQPREALETIAPHLKDYLNAYWKAWRLDHEKAAKPATHWSMQVAEGGIPIANGQTVGFSMAEVSMAEVLGRPTPSNVERQRAVYEARIARQALDAAEAQIMESQAQQWVSLDEARAVAATGQFAQRQSTIVSTYQGQRRRRT